MSPHASTRRRHVVRTIWWTHVSTRFPLLPEQRLQQQGGDARLAEEGLDEVAVAIEEGVTTVDVLGCGAPAGPARHEAAPASRAGRETARARRPRRRARGHPA